MFAAKITVPVPVALKFRLPLLFLIVPANKMLPLPAVFNDCPFVGFWTVAYTVNVFELLFVQYPESMLIVSRFEVAVPIVTGPAPASTLTPSLYDVPLPSVSVSAAPAV